MGKTCAANAGVKRATKGFCGSTRRAQTGGEAQDVMGIGIAIGNANRDAIEMVTLRGWRGATINRGG